MQIFYIEADRRRARRGQGGEIITSIEREVNDRGERDKDYNFTQRRAERQPREEKERRGGEDERTDDVRQKKRKKQD